MSRGVGGPILHRFAEFPQSSSLVMELKQSCTETVVGFPPWLKPNRGLEFFDSQLRVTLVFQCSRKVVMCDRVIGVELQNLAISGDGLLPRFGASECIRLLAVGLGRLS